MEELTWQQVLEGVGTDAYVEGMDTLPGGESKRGLMDRMRDIVLVRGALFPETVTESSAVNAQGGELVGDLDDNLLEEGDSNATEKSIDELLASLGELDDEDDGTSWKFDDEEDEKKEEEDKKEALGGDADEKMASIMDELQVWRGRNVSSPYEAWDTDRKEEFNVSFIFYCTLFVSIFYSFDFSSLTHHLFFSNSNGLKNTWLLSTQKPTPAQSIRKPRVTLYFRNAPSTAIRQRNSGARSVPKRRRNYS